MTPNPPRHGPQQVAAPQGRELLKSLSGAVQLISLYTADHPVAISTVERTWKLLQKMQAAAAVAVGLAEGRWIISGANMGEVSSPTAALAAMFRALELRTVMFAPGVRLFELTAFCRLAAAAAKSPQPIDPEAYLKQAGIEHIRLDASVYARVAAEAQAASDRRPAAALRFSGLSFGAFIKRLVDNAVADPEERAKIYGETLSQVKAALARRVAEAVEAARLENQAVSREMARTEEVLASMADGKVIIDRDGRVLMMDAVAEEIAGKRLVDVAGKSIQEGVAGGGKVVSMSADLNLEAGAEPSHHVHTSGPPELLAAIRHSTAVVQDEQGRVVGTCSVLPGTASHEETLRRQGDFVSHITHELNAPLASICAALEMVADTAGSKFTAQESHLIEVSLRNSRNLKQMISEILDFSKLQSGRMATHPTISPAASLLREAADALKPWAVSKQLTLEVAAGPGLDQLLVLADSGQVVQILTNLIANAIKSTPAGGRIVLAGGVDPAIRRAVLSVKDTGCGITPEDRKVIFQRFTQGAGGGLRREGVGLGLTIVKKLVGLHKGTLWLESSPGQGSTFFFSLPLVSRR